MKRIRRSMPPVGNSALPPAVLCHDRARAASQTWRAVSTSRPSITGTCTAASGAPLSSLSTAATGRADSAERRCPRSAAAGRAARPHGLRIGNADVVEQDVLEVGAGRRSTDQRRLEQRAGLDLDQPELVAQRRGAVPHPLRPASPRVPERLGTRRDDGAAVSLDAPVTGRCHGYPPPRTAAATLLAAVGPNDRYNRFGVAARAARRPCASRGRSGSTGCRVRAPSTSRSARRAPCGPSAHRSISCRLVAVVTSGMTPLRFSHQR